MDQWTARSMNLLRKSNKYKIHLISTTKRKSDGLRNFRVNPIKNHVCIYCAFCEDLDHLAEYLDIGPEETEKLIFSKGGRVNMGCWRRFVLKETS